MNIRYRRTVSAPYRSTSSSGSWTLPRDLLIRSPSAPRIWPWLNRRMNGSRSRTSPTSAIAFVKNRLYIRCMTACSAPPVYWSTGVQRSVMARSTGPSIRSGDRYRNQYHEESMNVSIVSVSRRAGPWQRGHVVDRNASSWLSGLSPLPL